MGTVGHEKAPITVALVGGRRFREQCLARYLELSGLGIRLCAVENLRENLLAQEGATTLAIIDAGHHSCCNPRIKRIFACLQDALPEAPVVVLSDREDSSAIFDALNLGVQAYFPSSLDPDILIETLRFVQKGGTFIPVNALLNGPVHREQSQVADRKRTELHGLTPSEQRVLELLKKGHTNKAIARKLDIEEATVKVHVRRIMKKLNAANRTQAALVAQQMSGAIA